MDYWQKRNQRARDAIANKTISDIDKQMAKYYKKAMETTIKDFEATYDKLLASIDADIAPTPADLYKLDKYWQMQGQLKQELQRLGDKSTELLQKKFIQQYQQGYSALMLPSQTAYATIDKETALQLINQIWVEDGKSWSVRVWDNVNKLADTLNDELVNCVVTGKKTTDLKALLVDRFGVSKTQAETLVRTEVAHIQVASSEKRYKDYGIIEYEFLGRDEHDIGCKCKKLNGKRFRFDDKTAPRPPIHPRCRCDIAPVVEE